MHTSALSPKWLAVVIGAILGLAAEGIVFGFAPEMGPTWTFLGTAAFLQIVITTALVLHLARKLQQKQHYIALLEASFAQLDPALVVPFEATVAGQDKETQMGRDAYLLWKAKYIQEFGVPAIIDHACRGTLPAPCPGGAGLVIHADGLTEIRKLTQTVVAAANPRGAAA